MKKKLIEIPNYLKNKKAILWDNDGVLVDTEKYFYLASKEVLKKAGFDFTHEMFVEYVLIQDIGPWHLLENIGFDKDTIICMKAERDRLYMDFLKTNDLLIEGVEETLKELAGDYSMGIVTSSKPQHFNVIHARTGILKYFDFVVTPENYLKYKPDPEPYITGWQKTNFEKDECIVVEDSRRGLLSAKAAGLDCIVIPNELTKKSDFKEADCILYHISEIVQVLD